MTTIDEPCEEFSDVEFHGTSLELFVHKPADLSHGNFARSTRC